MDWLAQHNFLGMFSFQLQRNRALPNRVVVTILHDDTLGTATSLVLAIAHFHLPRRAAAATVAATAGRVALHLAVVAANLSDNIVESLVNVDARLGGGLNEAAAE